MADVIEAWADTGEVIERDFTDDEQREHDERNKAERDRYESERESILAAIEHARGLGFTDSMIAVMFPALADHAGQAGVA